ncbi:MAG: hypothetical protein RIM99_06445 [Cyclobacteriaceae bacterium]
MNNFALRLYFSFERVNFYTVHFDNSKLCETDKFFEAYKDFEKLNWDMGVIASEIQRIGEETGAILRKFRLEGRAHALPDNTYIGAKLRLYCYRVSDHIVILGNGGLKTERTAQAGEFTAQHFDNMKNIAGLVKYRVDSEAILIDEKELKGNLKFTKK